MHWGSGVVVFVEAYSNKEVGLVFGPRQAATIFWPIWKERNSKIFEGKSTKVNDLFQRAKWRLSMWLLAGKSVKGLKPSDVSVSWEGCLSGGTRKSKPIVSWCPLQHEVMKIDVDGASRDKPGPVGIGGVLRNHSGISSLVFTKPVGVRDSNDAELLSIRREELTLW